MAQDNPVSFIEARFVNGKILQAEGQAANAIWDWYNSCEVMNCIHGAKFTGEGFTVTEPSK